MKKTILAAVFTLACVSIAQADPIAVQLYVDAAPNVYGSPNFAPWLAAAKAGVANGSFVNMAHSFNSANVGTTNFEIQDEVVYSFGDLGSRLHFIYWVPGAKIADLTAANFQVSMTQTWDGVEYSYMEPYTPTSWVEVNGGVFGTPGAAAWGAYGVNTQEALDADIAAWGQVNESFTISITMTGQAATTLTAYREGTPPVPAPGAALLVMVGVGLVGWLKRRFA